MTAERKPRVFAEAAARMLREAGLTVPDTPARALLLFRDGPHGCGLVGRLPVTGGTVSVSDLLLFLREA